MNKILIIVVGMLIIYASSTCTTSTTQTTLGGAMLVALGASTAAMAPTVIDIIGDADGNVYEIGGFNGEDRSFVRRVGSDGVADWIQYYGTLYITGGSSTLDSTEAYLRICAFDFTGQFTYLELDVTDGSINAQKITTAGFDMQFTQPNSIQCGFSPSKNVLWVSGLVAANIYVSIMSMDLTDLTAAIPNHKLATSEAYYYPLSHAGMDDTHVIATAILGDGSNFDYMGIFKYGWADPITRDWGFAITGSMTDTSQITKVLLNSDVSQAVVGFSTNDIIVVIHVLDTSTGAAVRQGTISGDGLGDGVVINSMNMVDDTDGDENLLYIVMTDTGGSFISRLDLTLMTGTSYMTTETGFDFLQAVSAQLSNDLVYISGSLATELQYGIMKVLPSKPFVLESFIALSTTYTIALVASTDTTYASTDYTLANIGIGLNTALATETSAIVPDTDEASTETAPVTITMNIWASAADSSVNKLATAATLSTEYTCIAYSGTGEYAAQALTYSLEDGTDDDVPTWITIDSSTATMTYTSLDKADTFDLIIRGTSSDADTYDTSIKIIVGGGSGYSGLSIYGSFASIIVGITLILLVV